MMALLPVKCEETINVFQIEYSISRLPQVVTFIFTSREEAVQSVLAQDTVADVTSRFPNSKRNSL